MTTSRIPNSIALDAQTEPNPVHLLSDQLDCDMESIPGGRTLVGFVRELLLDGRLAKTRRAKTRSVISTVASRAAEVGLFLLLHEHAIPGRAHSRPNLLK